MAWAIFQILEIIIAAVRTGRWEDHLFRVPRFKFVRENYPELEIPAERQAPSAYQTPPGMNAENTANTEAPSGAVIDPDLDL